MKEGSSSNSILRIAVLGRFGSLGEIVETLDRHAVHLSDDKMLQVFIAERVRRGEDLAQKHDLAAVRRKLVLEGIQINQTLRRVLHPVSAPLLQIRSRELSKDNATEDQIARLTIKFVSIADALVRCRTLVRVTGMVSRLPSRKIEKFTVSPTCGKGIGDMAEGNLSNAGFFVVPIRIDGLARYGEDDISLAQAGLLGGAPRSNFGDVDRRPP